MKNIFFLQVLLVSLYSQAQLSVNILIPPSGMMDKQQLWNIIATNTETTVLSIQVQANFSELATGQPVFTATAGPIMVAPGTKQLSATTIGPVQYNSLNPGYYIDPGPAGLLPVGSFTVCYNFLIEKYNKVVQECQPITIPPLGPLLLNQPSNNTVLQEFNPLFTWLPPSPINSLAHLRYDLRLVEIMPNQSAADALQNNIPIYVARQLGVANLLYSPSAPALSEGNTYAWQVTATNNFSEFAKSESWSFSIQPRPRNALLPSPEPVFIKLKKAGGQEGYAVCWKSLRFDYLNETIDSSWNILIEDLSSPQHVSFSLQLDSFKLKRGQNLVNYNAAADKRFIDKHQYLLRVLNSRNEVWQLRFEYRKQD